MLRCTCAPRRETIAVAGCLVPTRSLPRTRIPIGPMANRVRETHEKRRRQQAQLARRAAKESDRAERDTKKRADKLAGNVQPAPRYQTAAEMIIELEQQQQAPPPPKPKPPTVTPAPLAPKTP